MTTLPHRARAASRSAAAAAAALSLAGCGGETSTGGGGTPASIQIVSAPAGGSTAGAALAAAPTFVVRDARGSALGGVPLTVEVVAGGGTLAAPPRESSAGATPVGTWTLGKIAGENKLRIAVPGVKPETVTVNGVAGAPSAIAVVQGNDQVARAGSALPTPVRFAVRDQFGNGVAGVAVEMRATGGGSLGQVGVVTATGSTGPDGSVAAPVWTLARTAVAQGVTATVAAHGLTAAAVATVQTSFDIDVRFVGTATAGRQAAFTAAAARLRAIITGDLQNVSTGGPLSVAEYCGDPALPTIDETIDDVVIYAQVKAIDGVGKVLARAGPCAIRDAAGGRLPVLGVMTFDEADMARMESSNTLMDVVLHEMMHVLGFSAGYFEFFGLLRDPDTETVAYLGANGLRGCHDAGGAGECAASVPLENTGGAGTTNSHWRETTFADELMTGFISGLRRPLSGMTVGAFHDLGYGVNYDAKDLYSLVSVVASPDRAGASLAVAPGAAWEEVIGPRVVVSRAGVRRRLLEAR